MVKYEMFCNRFRVLLMTRLTWINIIYRVNLLWWCEGEIFWIRFNFFFVTTMPTLCQSIEFGRITWMVNLITDVCIKDSRNHGWHTWMTPSIFYMLYWNWGGYAKEFSHVCSFQCTQHQFMIIQMSLSWLRLTLNCEH